MKYPDKNILMLLIVRAAGGDARLAGLAMLERHWGNPVRACIESMSDAKKWRAGENQARRYWKKRGITWLAAGEERACTS